MRRDIGRLRDLGYDIRTRPGPGAGYRLHPSMKLPPLLLDADDVSVIIASLMVMEARTPDDPSIGTARSKLEQVLPPSLRRRAAATAIATQVLQQGSVPADWALVGTLADAVSAGARVRFAYVDQHGHRSQRIVEPYRCILRQHHWYLIAYDADREGWRLFRLDRIADISIVAGPHRSKPFPFGSIESWLADDFGRGGRPGTAEHRAGPLTDSR